MGCNCQASLSFTNSRSLLRLMSIESVMPSNHIILCHPLLLLPSIFPSISFRIDWFDLAVQGIFESSSTPQFKNINFFCTQPSLWPYMTTGKTIALTIWNFVGKVMPLLFNMLSRLFITFFPSRKCLLISWLQSPSAVILEPKKIKSLTVSPSICHEVVGLDAMIFGFWMLSFKPAFSLSSLPSSRGSLVPLCFLL